MKRIIVFVLLTFIIVATFVPLTASAAKGSYTYDVNGVVLSPSPAEVTLYFNGTDAGCGLFNQPRDMALSPNGNLYIADTGNNRIVVLDKNYKTTAIIDKFINQYEMEDSFNLPHGIFVSKAGDIYIADTGNKRVVVFDKQHAFKQEIIFPTFVKELTTVNEDGIELKFAIEDGRIVVKDGAGVPFTKVDSYYDNQNRFHEIVNPTGLYISKTGEIHLLIRDAGKVVVFDNTLNYKSEYQFQLPDVMKDEYIFEPVKVAADLGRIFVISKSEINGLMLFDMNGNFLSYTGANKVTITLEEIFKRIVATAAQREYIPKKVPTLFDNVTVDDDGFVYTVTGDVDEYNPWKNNPVRRQTMAGDNILRGNPVGDEKFPPRGTKNSSIVGPTYFCDIVVGSDNEYSVLDFKRGRIFTYDYDGNLLFIFGGIGDTAGTFRGPTAIERIGDKILVLDYMSGYVTVFTLSDYGKLILDADRAYYNGEYDKSEQLWKQALKQNSNLEIGYTGVSKVLLHKGQYKDAMEYAKLGKSRYYYSKAFQYYREQVIKDNIYWALGVILVFAVLIYLFSKFVKPILDEKRPLEKYETWRGLKYSFYIIFHPFDGFWDMHHEKKGNAKAATVLYALFAFVVVLDNQFNGFLFAPLTDKQFNILFTLASVVIPILLWCVCNWAVTTLFNGDGKLITIYTATAYSLFPYIIIRPVMILFSNFVTLEESVLIYVITAIAILWCAFLLFAAMLTIHQYTIARTIATILATILGMAIVVFIVMLLFSLIQQLAMFVMSIYNEIVSRM